MFLEAPGSAVFLVAPGSAVFLVAPGSAGWSAEYVAALWYGCDVSGDVRIP